MHYNTLMSKIVVANEYSRLFCGDCSLANLFCTVSVWNVKLIFYENSATGHQFTEDRQEDLFLKWQARIVEEHRAVHEVGVNFHRLHTILRI